MDRALLERAVRALSDVNAKPQGKAKAARLSESQKVTVTVVELENIAGERMRPPESGEVEQRFGKSHARLFPFIHKRVWTPAGTGILLSVFLEQCEFLPDGAEKTIRVQTGDVRPIH